MLSKLRFVDWNLWIMTDRLFLKLIHWAWNIYLQIGIKLPIKIRGTIGRGDEEIKENKHKIIFEQTFISHIKANTRNKLVFQRHKSWNIKHNGRKSMSCDVYIYSNEQYMFWAIRQHNKNKQNKLNSLLCYLQTISHRVMLSTSNQHLTFKGEEYFCPKMKNQTNSMINVLSKTYSSLFRDKSFVTFKRLSIISFL